MTLYELLQIKEDYIETSDVDYDVLVGTDLVKDEDINENTDNYYKFLNYIAHNVEVTDARNDICNWSKFVLDHKVALTKYAEENWYEVPEDESDFIYKWINELHGYQSGNTSSILGMSLPLISEKNYDMGSIVTAYGNDYQYPFKDYAKPDVDDYDNALTYLIHQQGHTVQDVLANHLDCCLSDEQISKSGFIKGVCTDIEENSSEAMSELGVYIELSGDEIPEFCEKLSDKNAYLVFDKDVNIGLFNEWSGTCGYPDNYLERDFVVPTTMVRNVQIEGVRPITRERAEKLRNIYKNTDSEYAKQRAGQNLETEGVIGYTIDGVCGMVGDFWKSNAVSYTDTAPTLVNEDIETMLNEIEQANKEKNEEIER